MEKRSGRRWRGKWLEEVCVRQMSRQKLLNKSMARSHKQVVREFLSRAALHLIG